MKRIAVIYHSAHGHTEFIAGQVAAGARRIPGGDVQLLRAEHLAEAPDTLLKFDGYLLGSPTFLGGVSAPFKAFMDATGRLWRSQQLQGRLAAGFTVSALPAGDKQSTLVSLFTFCMQHGMLWAGNPVLPEQHLGVPEAEAANRLGSWSGLMVQADKGAAADGFVPGDVRSALLFGESFALALQRLHTETPRVQRLEVAG
ncbi:flavodoxin family protein [Pseudomonas citronellolis]|uniref:flavodoxin family protein n=1 Tax=Pseudomonas citronellolis TaxID=53408 RepID=UPI0023E44801|nr:NAD(P)H-dependent oxidoreductase [Pseudomonas citronellolis]MDF3933538.1 NAD(P)H-dependent oxidoreductase [Pseudomonas citronellolis]